jgi:hypothetical protein
MDSVLNLEPGEKVCLEHGALPWELGGQLYKLVWRKVLSREPGDKICFCDLDPDREIRGYEDKWARVRVRHVLETTSLSGGS